MKAKTRITLDKIDDALMSRGYKKKRRGMIYTETGGDFYIAAVLAPREWPDDTFTLSIYKHLYYPILERLASEGMGRKYKSFDVPSCSKFIIPESFGYNDFIFGESNEKDTVTVEKVADLCENFILNRDSSTENLDYIISELKERRFLGGGFPQKYYGAYFLRYGRDAVLKHFEGTRSGFSDEDIETQTYDFIAAITS